MHNESPDFYEPAETRTFTHPLRQRAPSPKNNFLMTLVLMICVHMASTAMCAESVTPSLRPDLLVKDGEKVAFLGDSITQNGWTQPGGYVRLVAAGLNTLGIKIVPIPAGVGGNTSQEMLARLDRDVLSRKPDWLTLSCGVNDVGHSDKGVDLEHYQQNVTSIVDQARAKGIRVMILTATPIQENLKNVQNQRLASHNDFLRQFAKERNLPLAELNLAFQATMKVETGPSRHPTVDGVHMNPYGNRLMATGILRAFGVTDADLARVKRAWDQAPDGAAVLVQTGLNGAAPVSLYAYEAFNQILEERKLDPQQPKLTLYLKALSEVLQTHVQEDVIDLRKLQPEIDQAFARQIETFIAQARSAPVAPANP